MSEYIVEVSEERVELAGWSLTEAAISGSNTRLIAAKGLEVLRSDGITPGMSVGRFTQVTSDNFDGANIFSGVDMSAITSSFGHINITLPVATALSIF